MNAPEEDFKLLQLYPPEISHKLQALIPQSRSQVQQDLFVLAELNFKRSGYFVEFGATNGIDLSNTYLLEKSFGWKGILAEPATKFWADLERNRPDAHKESLCVWRNSQSTLIFNETWIGEFSTIDLYSDADHHSAIRTDGTRYAVKTISLVDLLDKYQAPSSIDFLSIDTEGSELEILEAFDFDRYSFKVIACEHNFGPQRERINELLSRHGYRRKFEEVSEWDDWYIFTK